MTASELNRLVAGDLLKGPAGLEITGVAALEDAGESDATFFGNGRYLPALLASRAGLALVPVGFHEEVPGVTVLIAVENPSLAFARVVATLQPPLPPPASGLHPTAVIDPSAQIGTGVTIQAHVVVEPEASIGDGAFLGAGTFIGRGSRIGANAHLHPRVTVRERVIIGARCVVHSGAVLGSDGFGFETVNGRHVKIPQVGGVEVGDDVEIGACVTIDRARFGMTRIGVGTKIDNLVQIAHNVVIGPHCLIVAQVGISGSTRLGHHVVLAGQVGVVGHINIGDGAIVGAQSGVSKSVKAGERMFGSPAEPMKSATESIARVRRLPKLMERVRQLEIELTSLRARQAG